MEIKFFQIESDEAESVVYTKIDRPRQESSVSNLNRENFNSDSSGNSDSDAEIPKKFMKRLEKWEFFFVKNVNKEDEFD